MVFKQRTFNLSDDESVDQPQAPKAGHPKRFSIKELQVATHGFSSSRIVGKGGFGIVYRGVLADGSIVAIKRLDPEHAVNIFNRREDSREMQFRKEIETGLLAQHPNLLRLSGFCLTKNEKCIVYPFIRRGSAESHLQALDWPSRKKIVLGVSRALAHLHDHCNRMIIHLDVKPANILLGDDFEPLLADFGFAEFMVKKPPEVQQQQQQRSAGSFRPPPPEIVECRSRRTTAPKDGTQTWGVSCSYWNTISEAGDTTKGVSCWYWSRINMGETGSTTFPGDEGIARNTMITDPSQDLEELGLFKLDEINDDKLYESETLVIVRGTYPYTAPEYIFHGRCSEKADVFGFGVTAFELITGKRVYDLASASASEAIYKNVGPIKRVKNKLLESMGGLNPNLVDEAEKLNLIKIALLCMQTCPEHRPKMAEVVTMLHMDADCLDAKWNQYLYHNDDDTRMSPDSFVGSCYVVDSTENQVPDELSAPR